MAKRFVSMKFLYTLTGVFVIVALPLSVWVAEQELGSSDLIELDGFIEPFVVVNLASNVYGVIEKINVERGDFVEKGQVLALLDAGKSNQEIANDLFLSLGTVKKHIYNI